MTDALPALFSLAGRTAVVTGAGGNLGPLWIRTLLEAGARVAALDLSREVPDPGLEAVLASFGPDRSLCITADVTDRSSLESARARVEEAFGTATVLVASAGLDQPPGKPVRTYATAEYPIDACRAVMEVNALGLFQTCQVFGGAMALRGGGSIVCIGSLYSSVSPDPRYYDHLGLEPPFLKPPAYGMSKAAVANLARYLAAHWGPAGVRVNTLSPGGVLGGQDESFKAKFTARVPLGRMADLSDLTGPLLFLASDASRYVTGQELLADGGYTVW